MTGLQVWLHPSSRTKSVAIKPICRDEACLVSACSSDAAGIGVRETRQAASLHPSPFGWSATIMRNRRRVLNGPHFDSRRGQRANGRFAPRSRTADPNIHTAHSMIARHTSRIRRRLLRRKWSPFAGSAESQRPRTLPRQNVPGHVRNGHDRVVERGLHVHQSVRNMLALLLLERLLLPFFLGRRGAACCCCCWFRHSWSSQFSVLSSQ
jgi:hypothetical protein